MRGSAGLGVITASFLIVGTAALPAVARTAAPAPTGGNGQSSVLYVDITRFSGICADTGTGTLTEPFCTVQAAANVVRPGQTVEVMATGADVVPQSFRITRSGTPAEPITFTHAPASSPYLSPQEQTGHAVITLDDVHDVTVKGLQVIADGTDDAIDVIGSSAITLSSLIFSNSDILEEQPPTVISVDGASSSVSISRDVFYTEGRTAVLAKTGASGVTVTTNAIEETRGSGITLVGASGAVVASNTVLSTCGDPVALADGTSGTVENNVLNAVAAAGANDCPTGLADLSVDASSAATVTTGYNAFFAKGTPVYYSWAGTPYSSVTSFQSAVPGQGTNDAQLPEITNGTPPEGSPAINSASCSAPGLLGTDLEGNPPVPDPLATDAQLANGDCHASRGALDRQDTFSYRLTQALPVGAVPFTPSVTVVPGATQSSWGEQVTYTVRFGDGSKPVTATPGAPTAHKYTTADDYTVTVTATDTGGSTNFETVPVFALPTVPLAPSLSAVPETAGTSLIPDSAIFTDSMGSSSWQVQTASIAYGDGVVAGPYTHPTNASAYTWNHTYATGGTYTAKVTRTDLLGRTTSARITITVGDEFAIGYSGSAFSGTVPAHGVVKVPYSRFGTQGQALIDIAVTSPKDAGYVTVYPGTSGRPGLASLRFQAGRSAENSALVTRAGRTDFYNGSAAPVHLTVTPYATTDDGVMDDTYTPVAPGARGRVLGATKLAARHDAVFRVSGADGIPSSAQGVVLDITASGEQASGYFATRPEDFTTSLPGGYFAKGQQVTGEVVLPVDGRAVLGNESAGTAVYTADVVGYYTAANLPGSVWLAASPDRLARITIPARHSDRILIAGKDKVPGTGTTAVQVNLTATGATAGGTITGYADGTPRPSALANLSYAKGTATLTAALIAVGSDGAIDLYNAGSRPVTLAVDLTGSYYAY